MTPSASPISDVVIRVSDDWLSPSAAAKLFKIGRRSVYRAIQRGELKASKVNGRDYRTCSAWLTEWMERRAIR